MRRTISLNCLAVVLFLFGTACSSGPSLDPYQGSLKDLLPEKVGEFKRTEAQLITRDMAPKYQVVPGANAGFIAIYDSDSSKA